METEQFYELSGDDLLLITVKSQDNIQWSSSPDYLRCELTKAELEKALEVSNYLKQVNYTAAEDWWILFCEKLILDEEVEYEESNNKPPPLKDFEPEYRLGSTVLRTYGNGDLSIVVYLKDSNEEIWANLGNVKELLEKLCKLQNGSVL